MSNQNLTRIATEIVTGYNSSNWAGLKELVTPDVIYNEFGTQRRIQGPDAVIKTLQEWKKALSDSRGNVTTSFASENLVALELTWQGTHDGAFTGPAGTLAPTGRRQTTPAAMIVKFQGDKIKEIHHYFDMMTFLQQLGAMPAAGARA